jgi:LysR family transcriptional regulator, glycine cleavage system transcriptional activator
VSGAYDRLPLNALRVFEAVATRLSFADAADALHVTPAAVSMQIRTLEEYLQVPLFRRSGRKVELTPEGEHLLPGIRRGLDELEAALNQLKQDRRGGPLHVSMLASFLQKWLLPRLPDLRNKHPDLELRIHTARDQVDFSRSDFHAAVRLGNGTYKGLHSEKVMDEWLVAVASPALLERHGPLDAGQSPERFPLLQGADEPWIHWLEVGGEKQEPIRGSVLDDSVSVLTAASEGHGFALVRWSLAATELLAGRLRLASPKALPYRWSYYFVCPKQYLEMPKVAAFRDWLRAAGQEFVRPETYMAEQSAQPTAVRRPVQGAPPQLSPARIVADNLASSTQSLSRSTTMSKGLDRKKEGKKKPQKTLEEKRAEKRAKKQARG